MLNSLLAVCWCGYLLAAHCVEQYSHHHHFATSDVLLSCLYLIPLRLAAGHQVLALRDASNCCHLDMSESMNERKQSSKKRSPHGTKKWHGDSTPHTSYKWKSREHLNHYR
jgi:hypothetical protein